MKTTLEESNLFVLDTADFVSLPNRVFAQHDVLLVWFDSNIGARRENCEAVGKSAAFDKAEKRNKRLRNQFVQNMKNRKVMYFYDEPFLERVFKLLSYTDEKDPVKKNKLLETEI